MIAGAGAPAAATFGDDGARGLRTCCTDTPLAEPFATRIRTAVASPSHAGADTLPGRARRASGVPGSGPSSGVPTVPALDQCPCASRASMVNRVCGSPCHFTPTRLASPSTTFDHPWVTNWVGVVTEALVMRTGGGVDDGGRTVGAMTRTRPA